MAQPSSAYADSRVSSDLDQLSDEEEDFVSSASTASVGTEAREGESKPSLLEVTLVSRPRDQPECTVSSEVLPPENDDNEKEKSSGTPRTACDPPNSSRSSAMAEKTLNLLDLPVDLLQEIIKEVTHTNDLTSLALSCSALHSLAIPQMYSRFDIVWPDAFPQSDHPAGVDALSYGLATLVMGEDIFHEVPSGISRRSCSHCGCDSYHTPIQPSTDNARKVRRGNYFAQYTRKFSVGNGPPDWVQEYSVTKETGKMLGTLVALAVARMINLETFVWDMPTGVVRDVWIALSSLADRPGHDCRLENVWIRWHDNSENTMRSLSGVPTTSSLTLPDTQNTPVPPVSSSSLLRKYGHVEYPSLSILPSLKSLSVLDIDEPSYLEEMAVLIQRSRERLKELRVGISSKVYQAEWLKSPGGSQPDQQTAPATMLGWPKAGGVLGALLGWPGRQTSESPLKKEEPVQETGNQGSGETNVQIESSAPSNASPEAPSPQSPEANPTDSVTEPQNPPEITNNTSLGLAGQSVSPSPDSKAPREAARKPSKTPHSSSPGPNRQVLKLEILELERVSISAHVLLDTLDWTRISTLTILRCEGHEKLWRALRRRFTPSTTPRTRPKYGRKESISHEKSVPEFPLRVKHIHTDAVSPYLLLFIKDSLCPGTLETLFLHGAPLHDSAVHIDAIYRNVIRNHRSSLRKLLVDSTERSTGGHEIGTTRWRKWMFTREMITFITSGRMPKLRELSMTLDSKDWHYFLQRLPYIPQLRALHIPHIVRPIHLDLKELALQVLDIVTLRPEIGLGYVGMQSKCYEILEGKSSDPYDFPETDDIHSEGFVPGAENWAGSDTNDEDTDDDGSTMGSHSELSSDDRRSLDDGDSDYESGRPHVSFRLREILFYDDKIAIFKARHGVL
ncbi:hypothetical protein ARAM_006126 [Aspergillus rambellii]|uniref:F-box domain-containing protein n=1 Tax=Aspergillus rambellii TaxID=308745 RepID=A0A0F8XAG0_9EURO|nr:hypothetical protein ARAM_006126 [Aspergillus rambellii]